jgi:hypothetical protein
VQAGECCWANLIPANFGYTFKKPRDGNSCAAIDGERDRGALSLFRAVGHRGTASTAYANVDEDRQLRLAQRPHGQFPGQSAGCSQGNGRTWRIGTVARELRQRACRQQKRRRHRHSGKPRWASVWAFPQLSWRICWAWVQAFGSKNSRGSGDYKYRPIPTPAKTVRRVNHRRTLLNTHQNAPKMRSKPAQHGSKTGPTTRKFTAQTDSHWPALHSHRPVKVILRSGRTDRFDQTWGTTVKRDVRYRDARC